MDTFQAVNFWKNAAAFPPLNVYQYMVDSLGTLIILNMFLINSKLLQHLFSFLSSWVLHIEIYLACDSSAGIIKEGTKERWKMDQGLQIGAFLAIGAQRDWFSTLLGAVSGQACSCYLPMLLVLRLRIPTEGRVRRVQRVQGLQARERIQFKLTNHL